MISQMQPSTSSLDIVPSTILKKDVDIIGPSVLSIVNSSLGTGCVPDCFKQATTTPLLKKNNLDPLLLHNYRPNSKVSFLSKIQNSEDLEKEISIQLLYFLEQNDTLDKFQSGFRKRPSVCQK
ncbi:hypothetical protein LDENG_00009560 [Lucifuga dentata]|nr:hypothetical protein LDENG_00009560 [Lucifuga dentata]